MNNPYFGWELLTKLIEDDVKSSEDLIVALVHWQLVQLAFTCLGVGDEKIIRDTDCGSEKLPAGWNEDEEHYSLRYALGGHDLYILKCVIIDGSTALFNLYNATKGTVSNLSFELRDVISFCTDTPKKKLVELMPKIDVHILRIREELILPVAGCFGCTNDTMPKRSDPNPIPRSSFDFKCLPNLRCPWPAEMAFGMPNRGILLPVTQRDYCAANQQMPMGAQQPNYFNNIQQAG